MANLAIIYLPRLNAIKWSCLFRQCRVACKTVFVSEFDPYAELSQTHNEPLMKVPKASKTEYLTSCTTAISPLKPEIEEKFDVKRYKDSQSPTVAYLANTEIAELVAHHLQEDINKGRCILEANPGFGYLSRRLINRGCSQLHLYVDKASLCLPMLETLAQQHSKTVKLVHENILDIKKIMVSDMLLDTSREKSCFSGLPRLADWTASPKITLFAVLNRKTEVGFLRSLLYMIPSRIGLFSVGRVELLVFMNLKEYETICGAQQRRNLSFYNVLYSLLFETKLITSVHSKNFLTKYRSHQSRELHLVRLLPLHDLSDICSTPEQFEEFIFFLQQGLIRGASASESLNMWIPHAYRNVFVEMTKSSSPLKNSVFNEKLSLFSPLQMVELFRILRNHEMFEHCSFREAKEKRCYSPTIAGQLSSNATSAE